MAINNIQMNFTNEFKGELLASNGKVSVGSEEGTLAPYDMLLGSLASCLYATFLSVANKKRINFESVKIDVTGEKREKVPTTLKNVHIKMTIKNGEKESGLIKCMDLATKFCSIYQTISKVSEMSYVVEFE